MEYDSQGISFGWASRDITPTGKVSLRGQFYLRITDEIHDPLTATALAIANADGTEQAILVSLDSVAADENIIDGCRETIGRKLEDFDPDRFLINATHTHTAPEQSEHAWGNPPGLDVDLVSASEYAEFLVEQVSAAAVEAWENRKPGAVSWGRGHTRIGYNRRTAYFDGSTTMYGNANLPEFSHMEGHEDTAVELLFTYNSEEQLTGMIVNVPCPSQCTEGANFISADFWHETRNEIRKRHGEEVYILPQASAAGDLAPRPMINREADARMMRLKGYGDDYNSARRQDIAERIASVIDDVIPPVEQDIRTEVEFGHVVVATELPLRTVTEEEVAVAKAEIAEWRAKLDGLAGADPASAEYLSAYRRCGYYQRAVDLHAAQAAGKRTMPVELHILRIGDIAMATNRFEYYLDYGERIKARSPALQTFIVQLSGAGGYLPTERSLAGGGYGAIVSSAPVGPEGGRIIVEKSVTAISGMFGSP